MVVVLLVKGPHLPRALAFTSLLDSQANFLISDHTHDKLSRDNAVSTLRQTVLNQLRDTDADVTQLQDCFNAHLRQTFRDMIFETDVRCDGRHLDELRKISCKVRSFRMGLPEYHSK